MKSNAFTPANVLTGARLVLFGWFVWLLFQRENGLAVGVFTAAWATDAVDGWLARSRGEATKFGYVFDKVVDRLLLMGGLVAALARGAVPPYAIWLAAKDIAALPALTIKWRAGRVDFGMGTPGKVMTWLQGAAFIWVMLDLPAKLLVVALVGAVGAVVGGRFLYHVAYGEKGFSKG